MNINKAIEHFKFKFSNVWKPTPKDIEAYNAILDFKEQQESVNLCKNESLTKLFIFTMIRMNSVSGYPAKECLKQIDDIFKISVYEWVKELQRNYFFAKFNVISQEYPEYLKAIQNYNITQLNTEGEKIFKDNPELLKTEMPKEEIYIKFIESQITRIINENENT